MIDAVGCAALHGTGHDAVDIQIDHFRVQFLVFGRAVCTFWETDKSHLVYLSRRHLHRERTVSPRGHAGLLRSDDKAGAVRIHATDQLGILIHYLGNPVFHDKGKGVRHVLVRLL